MVDEPTPPAGSEGSDPEIASDVSERVKQVIAAAEGASQALVADAEARARARRREADEEAERVVDEARREAEALTEGVRDAADEFLSSARAIVESAVAAQHKLEALVEEARASFARLSLETVQARDASEKAGRAPRDPRASAARGGEGAGAAEPSSGGESWMGGRERNGAARGAGDLPPPASEVAPAADAGEGGEEERARLVALRMAAAGRSRGEVAHHLQQNFDLERIEAVLAHVFGPRA